MIIRLSPQRRDDSLTITKNLDALTINSEIYDFSELPEGAVLPAAAVNCEFIAGDVTRVDGQLIVHLLLPCGPDCSSAANFPADIVNPPDGNVSLPQ